MTSRATCEHSHLDGSYVLGALSPQERQAFERHLADCAVCSASVRELAGLPGLLGRVDAETVESPAVEVPVPVTLLPSLVREVRRTQRRRLVATGALAAAAAAAVTVGSLTALGVGAADRAPDAAPPSAGATIRTGQDMVPVGYTRMAANLAFESVPWGTRLSLACSYAPARPGTEAPAATYALVVHTRDGQTEQVATWRALPGRRMNLDAATSTVREDIASVEVRTSDGEPVLKLTT